MATKLEQMDDLGGAAQATGVASVWALAGSIESALAYFGDHSRTRKRGILPFFPDVTP